MISFEQKILILQWLKKRFFSQQIMLILQLLQNDFFSSHNGTLAGCFQPINTVHTL